MAHVQAGESPVDHPKGMLTVNATGPGCRPGAFGPTGCESQRSHHARCASNAAVDQRQSLWFEKPGSAGSTPAGGTTLEDGSSTNDMRGECEFSARSHTPGHVGATPTSATKR